MMKQPAENPNATPLEEKKSAERVVPTLNPAEEYAEIEAEALRLAACRGGDPQSTQEEWIKAAHIVRIRRTSLSKG